MTYTTAFTNATVVPRFTARHASISGLKRPRSHALGTVPCRRPPSTPLEPRLIRENQAQMCLDAASTETVEELESLILSALVGKNIGRGMKSDDRERITLLVDCLEDRASASNVQFPERLDILDDACWNLVYSTEPLPPTAFLPTPLSVLLVLGIQQRYDTSSRTVDNVILLGAETPWRRGVSEPDAEVVVRNSFDVLTENTVQLAIESTELRVRGPKGEKMRSLGPALSVGRLTKVFSDGGANGSGSGSGRGRGIGGPGGIFGRSQSGEVKTSFCGKTLRIARSPGGELRIFSRGVL